MMNWEQLKNSIHSKYSKNAGKMILHVGVVTWAMASFAHVVAIVCNDKIPKDQKKFLIPQEIADGALNIAAFYLITKTIKDITGKLVSTGKWSNKSIRDFVSEHAKDIKMGHFDTNLPKTYGGGDEFHKAYDPFSAGIDMISASLGSVVSCNIATPFIRNSIAAKQQKKSLEKDNKLRRPELVSRLNGNRLKI